MQRGTLGEIGVGHYERWHGFKTQGLEGEEILRVNFLALSEVRDWTAEELQIPCPTCLAAEIDWELSDHSV